MGLDMARYTDEIARQNKSSNGRSPVRLGVDIGGTFTDVAAVDGDGILHIGKALI